MKKLLLNVLQKILKIEAKLVLKKHKPKIVGITGSVGKTSTKEAIFCVLENRFRVRKSMGSYNNELGVPLTIIGQKTAGRSLWGWFMIIIKGLMLGILKDKDYPEILVLELGVSYPGDMDYLTKLIKPDIACITAISEIPVHLKYFKNVDNLAAEKIKLAESLSKEGKLVFNYDDNRVKRAREKTKASILSYGFGKKAEVKATDIVRTSDSIILDKKDSFGLSFKLHYHKNVMPVRLPYILSQKQIYAALAAVAVGLTFEMNLVDIAESLKDFRSPKGRMNLISGIKYTHIIDDSYNASPDSVIAALDVLSELKTNGKKIAILGDMLELGPKTEEGHRMVGKKILDSCDILITVGEASKYIYDEALNAGMDKTNIFKFNEHDVLEAAKFVQNKILREGDLVLIKGSQAMRMEKAVKELMAEPLKAKKFLVRQDDKWKS